MRVDGGVDGPEGTPVAFVLLVPYMDLADDIVQRHEGGQVVQSTRGDEVLFRAYFIPASER